MQDVTGMMLNYLGFFTYFSFVYLFIFFVAIYR